MQHKSSRLRDSRGNVKGDDTVAYFHLARSNGDGNHVQESAKDKGRVIVAVHRCEELEFKDELIFGRKSSSSPSNAALKP